MRGCKINGAYRKIYIAPRAQSKTFAMNIIFAKLFSGEKIKMAKKNKRSAAPVLNIASNRVEFNPDYTNIKKDLQRIGILAGTFFVALIILSFFIK